MWSRPPPLLLLLLLLFFLTTLSASLPQKPQSLSRTPRSQPIFGITHLDIRDAILALERSIKGVASKLDRHEAREAQLAASTTKTLATLKGRATEAGTGVQAVARQLAMMEERLLSLEALVQTTDERQRMKLDQIAQGLDRLLARDPSLEGMPPLPNAVAAAAGAGADQQESAVLKVVKKLNRKISGVETLIQRDMRAVGNEVLVIGESLGQHMEQLRERHDRFESKLDETHQATHTSLQQLSGSLAAASTAIQEEVQSQCGGGGGGGGEGCATEGESACVQALAQHTALQEEGLESLKQETQNSLEVHLGLLQTVLLETRAGQTHLNSSVHSLTQSLSEMDNKTQDSIGGVAGKVAEAVKENLQGAVTALGEELHEANTNIMDMLDDRASQTENLHHTVLENYSELSSEINSLKKVEQVMIHTADSVLDTKRSIEFGIQQIIIELGEIVKSSGSTINTTLFDQINNISFAILKNQTSALTNMTAKMEQEISQVWRQIGIMYQQMTQSKDLLDQLKDTTKEHMNASLTRVGDMDGTVGKINTKVADVENNLNYLLGRLSLVVSEFNLMKSGVGEELTRLRDNMARENSDRSSVEFAEGGQPPSDSRYEVSRKREAGAAPRDSVVAF